MITTDSNKDKSVEVVVRQSKNRIDYQFVWGTTLAAGVNSSAFVMILNPIDIQNKRLQLLSMYGQAIYTPAIAGNMQNPDVSVYLSQELFPGVTPVIPKTSLSINAAGSTAATGTFLETDQLAFWNSKLGGNVKYNHLFTKTLSAQIFVHFVGPSALNDVVFTRLSLSFIQQANNY